MPKNSELIERRPMCRTCPLWEPEDAGWQGLCRLSTQLELRLEAGTQIGRTGQSETGEHWFCEQHPHYAEWAGREADRLWEAYQLEGKS